MLKGRKRAVLLVVLALFSVLTVFRETGTLELDYHRYDFDSDIKTDTSTIMPTDPERAGPVHFESVGIEVGSDVDSTLSEFFHKELLKQLEGRTGGTYSVSLISVDLKGSTWTPLVKRGVLTFEASFQLLYGQGYKTGTVTCAITFQDLGFCSSRQLEKMLAIKAAQIVAKAFLEARE